MVSQLVSTQPKNETFKYSPCSFLTRGSFPVFFSSHLHLSRVVALNIYNLSHPFHIQIIGFDVAIIGCSLRTCSIPMFNVSTTSVEERWPKSRSRALAHSTDIKSCKIDCKFSDWDIITICRWCCASRWSTTLWEDQLEARKARLSVQQSHINHHRCSPFSGCSSFNSNFSTYLSRLLSESYANSRPNIDLMELINSGISPHVDAVHNKWESPLDVISKNLHTSWIWN